LKRLLIKFTSVLTSLALICGQVPASAFAASETEASDLSGSPTSVDIGTGDGTDGELEYADDEVLVVFKDNVAQESVVDALSDVTTDEHAAEVAEVAANDDIAPEESDALVTEDLVSVKLDGKPVWLRRLPPWNLTQRLSRSSLTIFTIF
jgi:hypothetical protein